MAFKRRIRKTTALNPNAIGTYAPKCVTDLIKARAKGLGVSYYSYVCAVLGNEALNPTVDETFFKVPEPTVMKYIEEARAIYSFMLEHAKIKDFKCSKEFLMSCRFKIGVHDPETFMKALNQLIRAGLIEECLPHIKEGANYPVGYMYVTLPKDDLPKVDYRKGDKKVVR